MVPAGREAFVLQADLQGAVVFQQAQRGAAEDAEVGIGVALAKAGLVLAKRHVELPVQSVFNRPVSADCGGELLRGELPAEDVIRVLI